MTNHKQLKKTIALNVIFTFILQGNIILFSQSKNIIAQFERAKVDYKQGSYSNSIIRLERIAYSITEKLLDKNDIVWKCYALMGANYEQISIKTKNKSRKREAIKNAIYKYKVANGEWGLWKEIIENEKEKRITGNVIEKIGKRPPKNIDEISLKGLKLARKYFYGKKGNIWPWVIAGTVVIGVAAYFLFFKKESKTYTLTVTLGDGVDGSPAAGTYTYQKGNTVDYSYNLETGHSNLTVQIDGSVAADSGTITMDRDHTLTATADGLLFVTNKSEVTVPEEGTATFTVKLSASPPSDVNAAVNWTGGDSGLSVRSGSALTFTTSNWDAYQTVTLAAAYDPDTQSGSATINISANDIPTRTITAYEDDNWAIEKELTLTTGESYDFSERYKTLPSSGDFYCEKSLGNIMFYSDLPGQSGIVDIGLYPGSLADVNISSSGYNAFVTAAPGHVYVAKARESDYYIVFRVLQVGTRYCRIEWIYRDN